MSEEQLTFKLLREREGLSVEEVANAIGVKFTTIQKYEISDRLPTDKRVLDLIKALNCSEEEFKIAYMNHKMVKIEREIKK